MKRSYLWKIITIIILSVLIFLGLLYLSFTGKSKPEPTPTVEPTVEPTYVPTPEPTPTPTPEPTPIPVDVDSDDSIQRLVNKWRLLPETYEPSDLVEVNVRSDSPQTLRKEAAEQLEAMFQAAIDDEAYLKLVSGYRSYTEQFSLYHTYLQRLGKDRTNQIDSYPGGSEHQLGLAVDLAPWNGGCQLQTCYDQYVSYKWLSQHAQEYGFIERYPKGKEGKTGITYSPWHWRYVGVEEATKIANSGSTMEEYYGMILEE